MKNLLTMGHQEGFLVFFIYLLRFCQVSHSIGLMIDNQLVIIANDCYTRIAIGSKLPDMDIFSNVAVGSISECEDECSKRRNSCNAFAFGIGMKGNGTCALSVKMPKPEDLQSHADYDVYVRSQRSPHCEPDRLYKMGSGSIGQDRRNETMPTTTFGSGLLGSTMPNILSSPRTMGNMMPNVNDPSYQRGYTPSFDDERRITDIVRNRNPISPTSNPFITNNAKVDYNDLSIYSNRKSAFGQRTHSDPKYNRPDFHGSFQNPFNDVNHLNFGSDLDNDLHSYKSLSVHNGPFEVFSRPIFVYDGASKDRSPANFGFWNAHDTTKHRVTNHFNQHRHQEFHNNVYKNPGIITKSKQNELDAGNYDFRKVSSRPTISNLYGFDNEARIPNKGFKDTSEFWNPELMTMFRDFGTKITEKSKSCYRRLLSGKKSLDLHVRRAIECERLEDCHRACDYEKRFTCEGFNYRRIGHGTRGICEMTSVPYSRMNFHRDFISDPQCNYYEKDPNCVINTPETRPSWWNQPSRPGQSYGPPYYPNERPRPYAPDRRPLNEVPRPLDYDRRPLQEIPRPFDYDRRPSNEIPRPLDHRLAEHDRQPPIVYGYPHHRLHDDTFSRRNYPDSIRGGYPATRPEDRFIYSVRFPSRRPTDDDFYNKNPWTRYPSRRIDHDIGTNEIGSYLPDYRKDPTRDWSSYGSVYGGSYGYDTNYVGNFDIPKYHPKSQPKPYNNDQFYGEFYNYGGAFGYGDNYIPANQDSLYGGTTSTEECSVRAGAGFRLSRGVVRKTYLTSNLDQCENLCISEKSYVCMSFSYRYNVLPTDPTDNCLLSDVSYKDLNFYIDLEPDRDYDIYAIIVNSRTCSARREPSSHPDECFWRVRSGFGMPTDVVRKSLIVNDLGECQAECMTIHDFMCRSFTFKYGLEHGRSDVLTNCYLSDWPSQDINPTHMPDMDGAEVYERGSFGRGCEPYAVPFFNMERFNGKQMQGDEVCYSGYDKPCKLTPYAVLLATYVNSEQDCRQKCSKMRETDSVPCLSYSYKLTTHGTEENCLLSDVPIRDLRPGLDYTYDNDHVLYTWKDLDPYCVVSSYSPNDAHGLGGPNPPKPVLSDHSRPDFNLGRYPSLRPDDIYIDPRPFFTKPGSHGVRPFDPDKPDPVRPYPSGSYGYDGNKFGYGIYLGGFGSLYPDESSTFRYYTVNGYPCKRGTKCEKNKLAGFWACETEGGGFDSWDYCCAPTHHCGFSQGYHYPWCYVGLSEDQWRPCSEKYYPYLPSPRPFRPMIGSEDRYDRPNRPYDPNYYGRHWPITYLHREPPPNCTDSLASADNSGNRRLNETISTTIETPKSTTARIIKNDENNTMTTIRTRRRRLRVRTANDTRNDRNAIFSQKISSRIITNDATRTRENQTSWDRAGKIERVTRPTNTKPSLIMQTVTSFVTTNNVDDTQFEGVKNSDGMIKVPLIAPNRSLPVVRA